MKVVIEQRVNGTVHCADALNRDNIEFGMMLIIMKELTSLKPSFTGRGVVEYRYGDLSGNVSSLWFVTDQNLSTRKTCQNMADFSVVSCKAESYA